MPDDLVQAVQTQGGYVREVSEDFQRRQKKLLETALPRHDIVITTAQLLAQPAPRLITEAMVLSMRPGAVLVDLAAETGGNCELTAPDQIVTKHGVTILGPRHPASLVAGTASELFARNLYEFAKRAVRNGAFDPDETDELYKATLLTARRKILVTPPGAAPSSSEAKKGKKGQSPAQSPVQSRGPRRSAGSGAPLSAPAAASLEELLAQRTSEELHAEQAHKKGGKKEED